jgi:hypothetical protein
MAIHIQLFRLLLLELGRAPLERDEIAPITFGIAWKLDTFDSGEGVGHPSIQSRRDVEVVRWLDDPLRPVQRTPRHMPYHSFVPVGLLFQTTTQMVRIAQVSLLRVGLSQLRQVDPEQTGQKYFVTPLLSGGQYAWNNSKLKGLS